MSVEFNGLVVSEPPGVVLADGPKVRAFVSVVLNGHFRVGGIRVVEVDGRFIVAFPSVLRKDGRFQDAAHPISREARRWFDAIVLEAYVGECRRKAEWDAKSAVVPTPELREAG